MEQYVTYVISVLPFQWGFQRSKGCVDTNNGSLWMLSLRLNVRLLFNQTYQVGVESGILSGPHPS